MKKKFDIDWSPAAWGWRWWRRFARYGAAVVTAGIRNDRRRIFTASAERPIRVETSASLMVPSNASSAVVQGGPARGGHAPRRFAASLIRCRASADRFCPVFDLRIASTTCAGLRLPVSAFEILAFRPGRFVAAMTLRIAFAVFIVSGAHRLFSADVPGVTAPTPTALRHLPTVRM